MRIIAGEKRGHGLVAPKGDLTRPTLARVRESVFSILSRDIVGAGIIDLFAGAGTLGLEALSRGGARCTFVEKHPEAIKALRQNLAKLKLEDQSEIVSQDVFAWIRSADLRENGIIFADPPYHQGLAEKTLRALDEKEISSDWILVLQHGKRDEIAYNPKYWRHSRTEKYGETIVQFFASISLTEQG